MLLQQFQRIVVRQRRQHCVRGELHFARLAVRADGQRMRQRLQAVAVEQQAAQAQKGQHGGAETAEVGGAVARSAGQPEVQYCFVVDVVGGELVACFLLQKLRDGAELALRLRRGKVVAQRRVESAGQILGNAGDGLATDVLCAQPQRGVRNRSIAEEKRRGTPSAPPASACARIALRSGRPGSAALRRPARPPLRLRCWR